MALKDEKRVSAELAEITMRIHIFQRMQSELRHADLRCVGEDCRTRPIRLVYRRRAGLIGTAEVMIDFGTPRVSQRRSELVGVDLCITDTLSADTVSFRYDGTAKPFSIALFSGRTDIPAGRRAEELVAQLKLGKLSSANIPGSHQHDRVWPVSEARFWKALGQAAVLLAKM